MNALPGQDIQLVDGRVASLCVRCRERHFEDGELCHDCLTNPLFDRMESIMLNSRPERFCFMGWEFSVTHAQDDRIYLKCYKRLFNPEKAGEVLSHYAFDPEVLYDHSIYRECPPRFIIDLKKRAAAWLIAHWWEHYLNICPCLHGDRDDQEDSPFRQSVISGLLWYDQHARYSNIGLPKDGE